MADRIHDVTTDVYIREMAGRDGRQGSQSSSIKRVFLCYDNPDPLICRDAIFNQRVPLDLDGFAGLALDSLEWGGSTGPTKWEFTANYADVPEVAGYTIQLDTGGASETVTEAYFQSGFPASGMSLPLMGTSINLPEGTDRVIPALKLNIRAKIASKWVVDPIGYAKLVASVTGAYNGSTYLGFQPGELLFRGGSGEIVGENPELSYTFEASPNITNGTLSDISGINRLGHDFQWLTYKTIEDPNDTKVLLKKATALWAATIYGPADFSVLRIGEA